MGVMVSASHAGSAAPSSSGGRLLTLCPGSSERSLSRETVLHKLLQRESFRRAAAPPHGLQLFTHCPSVGPSHRVQSFRNRLLQRGSPRGHSFLQASLYSWHGVPSMGYRWRSAPPWTFMPASPWSSSPAAREGSLLLHLKHLLPLLLH